MPRKITRRTTKDLNYDRLRDVLRYKPKTGKWIWRISPSTMVSAGNIAGCVNPNGYRYIRVDGKLYKSSRLAFLYMLGYFPEHEAEHRNRICDDDRWDNLREATRQCNLRNCGVPKNNTSGVVGVYLVKPRRNWQASICINYKKTNLGYFTHKIDAAKARWKAEVENNFPDCNTTSSAYLYIQNNVLSKEG